MNKLASRIIRFQKKVSNDNSEKDKKKQIVTKEIVEKDGDVSNKIITTKF